MRSLDFLYQGYLEPDCERRAHILSWIHQIHASWAGYEAHPARSPLTPQEDDKIAPWFLWAPLLLKQAPHPLWSQVRRVCLHPHLQAHEYLVMAHQGLFEHIHTLENHEVAFSPTQLQDLLHHCPGLTRLRWSAALLPEPSSTITLPPWLSALELWRQAAGAWHQMTAPSRATLSHLTLYLPPDRAELRLDDSWAHLEHLSLLGVRPQMHRVCFQAPLPRLRSLSLQAVTLDHTSPSLPSLHQLSLAHVDHANQTFDRYKHLQSLRISSCPGLEISEFIGSPSRLTLDTALLTSLSRQQQARLLQSVEALTLYGNTAPLPPESLWPETPHLKQLTLYNIRRSPPLVINRQHHMEKLCILSCQLDAQFYQKILTNIPQGSLRYLDIEQLGNTSVPLPLDISSCAYVSLSGLFHVTWTQTSSPGLLWLDLPDQAMSSWQSTAPPSMPMVFSVNDHTRTDQIHAPPHLEIFVDHKVHIEEILQFINQLSLPHEATRLRIHTDALWDEELEELMDDCLKKLSSPPLLSWSFT
jgi:hypothetical protein